MAHRAHWEIILATKSEQVQICNYGIMPEKWLFMSKYLQGQMVALKSDRSITGAIVAVIEGYPETRYQVFTAAGLQ